MTFEDRINKFYHELNGTDKHIIKQIIVTKPVWDEMTQQKLADLCNASTASIHRMLKRLSFTGFSEFKFFMINAPITDLWKESDESYRDFLIGSIDKSLELNSSETLNAVYDVIAGASSVYGYGTGTEQFEALNSFSNHLMYYDRSIIMLNTITDINLMSLKMNVGDVFVIASLSGNTPMLDEMVEILKLKGITIVSITNNTKNAIASSSDLNLYFQDDAYHGIHALHWPAITMRVLFDYMVYGYVQRMREVGI